MKKIILASAMLAYSFVAFADNSITTNNPNFTGFGVGATLGMSKYTDKDPTGIDFKNITDAHLVASYGFGYGNSDFVGQIEANVKLNRGTVATWDEGLGSNQIRSERGTAYVQGYRVTPDLMPYVKLGYLHTQTRTNSGYTRTWRGVVYGVGVKYAATRHIEVGAEYANVRFADDNKNRRNGFNVGATYRF
ncbi:MAG: porin [Alysiella sp.]|uniref:outer membrane beta-barrel protein n=1 Tax=Alysiella sp. TaxID=1872483 RepID=UPI0026DABD1F|nr:outer membrane beta-barrel protein [Alysiella sp.]MDO4433262.1 porin [Alysiella sp.]